MLNFIQKPTIWPSRQIKRLVSTRNETLGWNSSSYYCILWKQLRSYKNQSTNLTVWTSKWIKSLEDLTSEICISRRNPQEVSIVVVSSHLKCCLVAVNQDVNFHSNFMTMTISFRFSCLTVRLPFFYRRISAV